jgi:hypothetical protein
VARSRRHSRELEVHDRFYSMFCKTSGNCVSAFTLGSQLCSSTAWANALLSRPEFSCTHRLASTTSLAWVEACAFCHTPETGFTGPVSQLNQTTGAYPGSVRTRFSDRKPQTHSSAPLSPVLHFNPYRGDMVGRNFWDMRATGRSLGNPAAEQAEGPPAVTSIEDHQDFRGTE